MRIARILILFCLSLLASWSNARSIRHNYHLKNVLWSISFSTVDRSIAGDVTNTVTLLEDTSAVEFHQINLKVSDVTVNGVHADFETHDDALTVTLSQRARAGETLKVRAIYTSHPESGVYFVPDSRAFPAKTGMVYSQGEPEDNRRWLLTYDYPDDKATTEAFITVPRAWTAISNGRLIEIKESGNQRVFHWKMDQPFSTYLISFVAGQYVKIHDSWHNIPVDIYVPPGLEASGKSVFGEAPKIIDLFSRLTGVDYPYPKFSQEVVAEFGIAGMENITAVTLTIDALYAPGTEPINNRIDLNAHELAHQWFGDLVTCQTWIDMWLNEGFADMMTLPYFREARGVDTFDFLRCVKFEEAINSIGGRNRKDVAGTCGSLPGPNVNIGSDYEGGSARLLMLMHLLGEEKFWKGVHDYLITYQYKGVTTARFFDAMSKSGGVDLTKFKQVWFYSPAAPSISADVRNSELVLSQLQPYYELNVPVWFLDGETWIKKSVHLQGKESTLPLGELAGKPYLVDPEVWLLTDLKYNSPFTAQQVTNLYLHAPNAAQKYRIMLEMFPWVPMAGWLAIAENEPDVNLLRRIVERIDLSGLEFCLTLAKSSDLRRVLIAIDYLGRWKTNPGVQFDKLLAEIAANCPNETLRERATRTLLQWTQDPPLADRAWKTPAFDDGFRRMALDWYGTHDPDKARRISLSVLAHPDNEPLRILAIRVLGHVKEVPGKFDVFNALLPITKEETGSARDIAREAIRQLGK